MFAPHCAHSVHYAISLFHLNWGQQNSILFLWHKEGLVAAFSRIMYEDKAKEKGGTHISEKDRVLAWTKDVAESTAKEAPYLTSQRRTPEARHIEREPPKVIVNQIVTTPAVIVTRARPDPAPRDEISTKAVIGTVLGATAGAVVAYGAYNPTI